MDDRDEPRGDRPSDGELVQRCLAGPAGDPAVEGAFRRLYERHELATLRFLRGLCGSDARARDAFQETLLRALESLPRFEAGRNFRAWLLGVARHAALDLLRRESARPAEPLPAAPLEAAATPCRLERAELAHLVQAALRALPDDLRRACELRQIEGCSHEEVAAALGCSLRTAKTRQRQALTLLGQELRLRGLHSPAPRGDA